MKKEKIKTRLVWEKKHPSYEGCFFVAWRSKFPNDKVLHSGIAVFRDGKWTMPDIANPNKFCSEFYWADLSRLETKPSGETFQTHSTRKDSVFYSYAEGSAGFPMDPGMYLFSYREKETEPIFTTVAYYSGETWISSAGHIAEICDDIWYTDIPETIRPLKASEEKGLRWITDRFPSGFEECFILFFEKECPCVLLGRYDEKDECWKVQNYDGSFTSFFPGTVLAWAPAHIPKRHNSDIYINVVKIRFPQTEKKYIYETKEPLKEGDLVRVENQATGLETDGIVASDSMLMSKLAALDDIGRGGSEYTRLSRVVGKYKMTIGGKSVSVRLVRFD